MSASSSRSLLFGNASGGGVAASVAGAASAEATESANDAAINHLASSTTSIKHVALTIEQSVTSQNATLSSLDKRFNAAQASIVDTTHRLRRAIRSKPLPIFLSALSLALALAFLRAFFSSR
ncbi:hypothetical protein BWQ96_08605 [Gracilariopsis chorda]|uniref:t-SNARE coiled-coil homology domain-containing protein n=1 Tax=Gracilariopsis chorda TaxID=448386 RepID=A0A2V3IHW3_9FLOR|nr:hypothetical protein BWQ96_08605 [Gracilariopsis chorda]|eukprot:PXF41684.1 hypothetical protein BWQ96_08605 [Gracilariopsis chorda]